MSVQSKIPGALRTATIVVGVLFALNLLVLGVLAASQAPRKKFAFDSPKKILVLAAHNDDEIIQAGGLLIRNGALHGRATVVVLTREPDSEIAAKRRAETEAALRLLPGETPKLISLDFVSSYFWPGRQIARARNLLREIIEAEKPDIVVLPLKEDGHYEHDLLAEMGTQILAWMPSVTVLRTPEYNPVYRAVETPGKLLWFLVRLLPFVPFQEPNYGLYRHLQAELDMTPAELAMKKLLLHTYTSQLGVVPETQFGFADLIEEHSSGLDTSTLIQVREKFFSPWAAGTVILLFTFTFCLGGMLSLRRTNVARIGGAVLVFAACLAVYRLPAVSVLNDGLLPLLAACGYLFTLAAQETAFRIGSHRTGDRSPQFVEAREDALEALS